MFPVRIADAKDDISPVVTSRGQLVTAPLEFSASYQVSSSDTAIHNVVPGRANKLFVMTALLVAQDKVNTDVDVSIFEADSAEGVATKTFIDLGTTRSDRMVATSLNMATGETKWINFQHDSATATINVTIGGYYIDA